MRGLYLILFLMLLWMWFGNIPWWLSLHGVVQLWGFYSVCLWCCDCSFGGGARCTLHSPCVTWLLLGITGICPCAVCPSCFSLCCNNITKRSVIVGSGSSKKYSVFIFCGFPLANSCYDASIKSFVIIWSKNAGDGALTSPHFLGDCCWFKAGVSKCEDAHDFCVRYNGFRMGVGLWRWLLARCHGLEIRRWYASRWKFSSGLATLCDGDCILRPKLSTVFFASNAISMLLICSHMVDLIHLMISIILIWNYSSPITPLVPLPTLQHELSEALGEKLVLEILWCHNLVSDLLNFM